MQAISRPIQAEAYNLAVDELSNACPDAVKQPRVLEAVLSAVLDLAAAGQTDAEALARYAVSCGQQVYQGSLTSAL